MVSDFVYRIIDKYTAANEPLREIILRHSEAVARKAVRVAKESRFADEVDFQLLQDAAMLHDIGIVNVDAPGIHCFGDKPYIRHGLEGAEILRNEGLDEKYQRVCMLHTGSGLTAEDIERESLPLPKRDFLPETLEEKLICYADKFFSKSRELDREKSLEDVMRSMNKFGGDAGRRFLDLHNLFSHSLL